MRLRSTTHLPIGNRRPIELMSLRHLSLVSMFCGAMTMLLVANDAARTEQSSGRGTNLANAPMRPEAGSGVTTEKSHSTTGAYEREALRLLIQEANKVAGELGLREKLPITEAGLARVFILRYD